MAVSVPVITSCSKAWVEASRGVRCSFAGSRKEKQMKKFALVFPGQGSQTVGMMQPFSESKVVRGVFSEASEALGEDLWKLAAGGPPETLNSTVNTQPVMLTAGY